MPDLKREGPPADTIEEKGAWSTPFPNPHAPPTYKISYKAYYIYTHIYGVANQLKSAITRVALFIVALTSILTSKSINVWYKAKINHY